MKSTIEFSICKMVFDFGTKDIIVGENTLVENFNIYESTGIIPYYELTLSNSEINPFCGLKDIEFQYISDNLSYECTLGVNRIKEIKGGVMISGWMVKQEQFKEVRTRYLGNNIKTAFNRLNIRKTLNSSSDNPNFNIFQINQSDACQALLLCKYATSTPYWYIGRYSINLDEIKEVITEETPLMKGISILTNTDYSIQSSQSKWISSVSSRDLYQLYNTDELTSARNRLNMIEPTIIGPRYSAIGMYSGEYSHPIGTKIVNTNSYYNDIKTWVVAACYYHYTSKFISTDIQYIGLRN